LSEGHAESIFRTWLDMEAAYLITDHAYFEILEKINESYI
jgi:hypothetical protein